MKEKKSKSQSLIEYVAIILVIIGVFIAMGAYYKRGLMGKYRQAGDVLSAGGVYYNAAEGYTDKRNPQIKF